MTDTPKFSLDSAEAEQEMKNLAVASSANEHLHDLRHLTAQETNLVAGISMGLSKIAAAKRAGMGVIRATKLLEDPSIQHHLEMLHQDRMDIASDLVKYDMVDAHMDIEMCKKMSANAMEWFRGVEMHMKLHGLGQETKTIDVNISSIQKVDQLAELDDNELLKLMGSTSDALTAEAHDIVDGEFTE